MSKIQLLPTTKDVARLAGVSPATVSYVINGRPDGSSPISEATRKRVLQAMGDLNYVPNLAGRNLRRHRTERVCLFLDDLGVPYDNRLAKDIQKEADNHQHSLIVAIGGTETRKTQVLKQLQSRLADGAIIKTEEIEAAEIEPLVKAHIATVVFSNRLAPKGFDVVRTNEVEAAYKAVKYLLEKGHRRIAFIKHNFTDLTHYTERLNSYKQALFDYGVRLDSQLIVNGADRREEAYLNTKKLLQLEQKPTAIFAASDVSAISAIWAIRDAGLSVPADIAVIGMGNIPESQHSSPALTTAGLVSLDFTEVANLLFSRIENPSLEGREHWLNWELLLRGSA